MVFSHSESGALLESSGSTAPGLCRNPMFQLEVASAACPPTFTHLLPLLHMFVEILMGMHPTSELLLLGLPLAVSLCFQGDTRGQPAAYAELQVFLYRGDMELCSWMERETSDPSRKLEDT